MIEELLIRDLGVIREARLPLHPGLTVITGETGAGKTMLLTGIDLLRGGRPDPSRVRAGSDRAEVEALVVVPERPEAHAILEEADALLDDGVLIVGRSVPVDGRSRSRLGGRSVPSAVLAELGQHLIAVHGQGEQQRLARPDVQRQVLDRVAGPSVAEPLGRYRAILDDLRSIEAEVAAVVTRGAERAAEAQRLQHLLADLDALAPEQGEQAALAAELSRLTHAEALRLAAGQAHEALSGDSTEVNALGLLASARRALEQARGHDPMLGELADRIGESTAQLADTAADLAAYEASLEADPARLDAAHRRIADLTAFERRHAATTDDVLARADELRARLDDLADGDGLLARLRERSDAARAELAPLALELHEARARAAAHLTDLVGAELAALAMPQARVEWRVDVASAPLDDPWGVDLPDGRRASLGSHGVDDVSLLLASHRDAPLSPLAKAASGGELSRVMLALEVVLAGGDPVPTMVFDEVDAGVGGRAAVEVGRRLAALARTTQVLVVTHLAQVAAFADRHLVVTRSADDEVTTSGVAVVEGDERVRELARMLAGLDESESAADHARELLALAQPAGPPPKRRAGRK